MNAVITSNQEGYGNFSPEMKPFYIATPVNREGKDNGMYILDEAAFLTPTLEGRLCPLIQGVDNENKPPDPCSSC